MTVHHPESARAGFARLVGKLSRQWRRAIDAQLQPIGLTEATWIALLHISRAEETMRQKDLAGSLGLDNSSVVRLLSTLEAGGYITREEGKTDRRSKALTLTALGKTTVARVEKVSSQARQRWLKEIGDAELAVAYDVVSRISDAVTRSLEDGK